MNNNNDTTDEKAKKIPIKLFGFHTTTEHAGPLFQELSECINENNWKEFIETPSLQAPKDITLFAESRDGIYWITGSDHKNFWLLTPNEKGKYTRYIDMTKILSNNWFNILDLGLVAKTREFSMMVACFHEIITTTSPIDNVIFEEELPSENITNTNSPTDAAPQIIKTTLKKEFIRILELLKKPGNEDMFFQEIDYFIPKLDTAISKLFKLDLPRSERSNITDAKIPEAQVQKNLEVRYPSSLEFRTSK